MCIREIQSIGNWSENETRYVLAKVRTANSSRFHDINPCENFNVYGTLAPPTNCTVLQRQQTGKLQSSRMKPVKPAYVYRAYTCIADISAFRAIISLREFIWGI